VGAGLFRVDGQTIRHNEAAVASRSSANASKSSLICRHIVFMTFLSISEQTAILSPNRISCAVAVMVGTGFLDVI